ncbi:MAG: HAMP domain-containing histidine kinase [Acidobacteria bacterium]|nr:HAMP domain-containing histidine kinase [Acidobacteriota bacterium]
MKGLRTLLLVLAAVGVPLGSWAAAIRYENARRAERIRAEPPALARATAERLARNLVQRLTELKEREARRPYYHYQSLFYEEGPRNVALQRSPLNSSVDDPLVAAYFQSDSAGKLVYPALKDPFRRPEAAPSDELTRLSQVARRLVEASRPRLELDSSALAVTQNVSRTNWVQQQSAQSLSFSAPAPPAPPKLAPRAEVVIAIGRFRYLTFELDGAPLLLCVRDVMTPAGSFSQGLRVNLDELAGGMRGSALPARLLPGPPSALASARVAVDDAVWHVRVDDASLAPVTAQRIADAERLAWRGFGTGAALAMLAGALVLLEVRRARQQADERSRFAAAAAHELRTPLAALRLHAELLAEGLGDPSRRELTARRVADEAARLGRVVTNVLGFTRLERGGFSVVPVEGDLVALVRRVVAAQEPACAAQGVRLVLNAPAELPATFDADAVEQILLNLLDNAARAARETPDSSRRQVDVTLAAAANSIELRVSDRGAGVPKAMRKRLFSAFASSQAGGGGLGLGLALVKSLAHSHGGRVRHEAPLEGGAVFVVTFPQQRPSRRRA